MTLSKADLSIPSSQSNDKETSLFLKRFMTHSESDQKRLFYMWQILAVLILSAHFSLVFACPQSVKLFPLLTLISVICAFKYDSKALYGGASAIIAIACFNAFFETFSLWSVLFCLSSILSLFTLYGCFKELFNHYDDTVLYSEKCKEGELRLVDQLKENELERLQEREELLNEIEKLKGEAELRKLEKNTLGRLLENAKAEILSFNSQRDRVIQEVKELRVFSHTLKIENQRLNLEVETLKETLCGLESVLSHENAFELQRLCTEKEELQAQLAKSDSLCKEFEQSISLLTQEKEQVIQSKVDLENTLEILTLNCENLESSLVEKEAIVHSKIALEERCLQLQHKCEEFQLLLTSKTDELHAECSKQAMLKTQYDQLNYDYQDLLRAHESNALILQTKTELENQYNLLQQRCIELKDSLNNSVDCLQSERSQFESLKEQHDRLSQEHLKLMNIEEENNCILLEKSELEADYQLLKSRCDELTSSLNNSVAKESFENLKHQHDNLSAEIQALHAILEQKNIELNHHSEILEEERLAKSALAQEKTVIEVEFIQKFNQLNAELLEKERYIERILSEYEKLSKEAISSSEKDSLLKETEQNIQELLKLNNKYESQISAAIQERESLTLLLEEKNQVFEDLERQKKQLIGLLNQLKIQFEEKNRALSEARTERYELETKCLLLLQEKKLEEHSQDSLWASYDELEKMYSKERQELLNEIEILEETVSTLTNGN